MAIKKWRWLDLSDTLTPLPLLIRILNERLKLLASTIESIIVNINNGGGGGSQIDGLYAAEGFLFNAGNVLVAGESDWLDMPTDFTITNAEIVGDPAGTISVDVYESPYATWDIWNKISGTNPITLSGTDKNRLPALTGWTTTFTGGRYLKFVVTGTPTLVTKATVTLTLAVPATGGSGLEPGGPAGGVLGGTYPDPTFAEDMATQAELDAAIASAQAYADVAVGGLPWKRAVRAATTAAGTLATSFENGDAIDGITLATGDRILVKDQASPSENGIYVVNASGAPTRATDADASAELVNATVYVSEGATLADTQWTCSTNAPITVGVTGIVFVQLSGGVGPAADDTNIPWPWADLPAVPSLLDDQFPGTTLDPKWSTIGGAGLTATVKNGWLVLEVTATGAAFNLRGIEQVLPAGNFSVFTIVRQLGFGQYSMSGVHVRNATSGALLRATSFNNSSSLNDSWWGAARYSSLTNRTAVMGEASTPAGSIREFIQRISYDGTNIVVSLSRDGLNFYQVTSEAIGTTFGAGAPNRVGLAIDAFSATLVGRAGFRVFKYVPTANATIGAFG